MERYEKYKPTGIDWLGEIPIKWDAIRLKFLLERNDGGVWGDDYDGIEENATKVFRSTEINVDGSWNLNEEPALRLLSAQEKTKALLKEGDLLVTKSSGSQLHIGKTALVTKDIEELECCFSNFMQRLRPKNKKVAQYLHIFLNSQLSRDQYNYQSNSTTGLANLSAGLLADVIIPTPLPDEQNAIAAYLDEKTAQIDKLIANKQTLIELLKEERTAIINQAVTKGINPEVKLKPSGVDWLGNIPAHWKVKRLKYLIKKGRSSIKTGPFGSQIRNSDLVIEGPFKVYNQRNVLDNDFDKGEDFIEENKFDDLKDFEVFERDVLFTTRGTIGKCAIFPSGKQRGVLHPCLIRVQFDDSKVDKEWIRLFVNQSSLFLENVMLLSNSTTIEVIYSYNLKEVYIPLPETIKEQNDILTQIEVETRRLDATISKIEKEIELLQEYRTALISEVVKGKIKVM